MLPTVLTTTLGLMLATTDTTVTFGVIERDLTGDSIFEVLTLTGVGSGIASLEVTFTIQSSGQTRYSRTWHLTRARFDARRRISDAELRARLTEYGSAFFADSKFMSPSGFVAWLQASAPLHIERTPEVIARDMPASDRSRALKIWEEMQAAGITLFSFSPGGDSIEVIGWSVTDQRFYDLLDCC
jgi:hypothetical protein